MRVEGDYAERDAEKSLAVFGLVRKGKLDIVGLVSLDQFGSVCSVLLDRGWLVTRLGQKGRFGNDRNRLDEKGRFGTIWSGRAECSI